MRLPLQITARNFELTEALEEAIRRKADKLDQFSDNIVACRVVVDCPHRHHHKGALYNVTIDLSVPGHEFVVSHEPNEDLYVALRDAFDAARRQLLDHLGRNKARARQAVIAEKID